MSRLESAADVGRLLAFALNVRATPGSSGESADYARLVERYIDDAAFRSLFDGVAEGVGCHVVAFEPRLGVVLQTNADGPWAWPARSSDLPWHGNFEDAHARAARALVVVALVAYIAPTAADLHDRLSDVDQVLPPVGVRELEQFIRDFCAQQEHRATDPSLGPEHRPLWWHWLQLPPDAPSVKRIARSNATFIVHDVLAFLHREGWLVDTTSQRAAALKRYRPRRRFLYHYRDLLLDELFLALQRHAATARVSGTPADSPAESPDGE